ncbi:MAG: phosphatase PAP2 family protein, partial [Muribaculaceae bacterium]|nr:phosphatase PAP2 family protein [Muribaculaceae bacterium]
MNFDDSIILAINGDYPKWVDDLMIICSDRFVWLPLYALLALYVVRQIGWKQGLMMLAFCGMAIGLADWVCATAIRPYVCRLRPISPDNPISPMLRIINGVPRSYSFPSCHASNTVALAMFMSLVFRRRWVTISLFSWSAIICFSRLYMGAHYLTDILAGAAIGAVIATGLYYAARGINRRYLAIGLLMITCSGASAETFKFEYSGEMNAIFDNREGKGLYTPAKTYF